MTTEVQAPRSVSSFLHSYSPDIFEWECNCYNPFPGFVWSKPLLSAQSGSFACDSIEVDALFCDGRASPGSDSLSDMSISQSDTSSGRFLAMPPRMNRTRNGHTSALDPSSDSRTFSDMSISSAAGDFSDVAEDVERFVRNLPVQYVQEQPRRATFPDRPSRLPIDSGGCVESVVEDDGPDTEAVCKILEWTTSLFASVASSALDYSIQPGTDDVPEPISSGIASPPCVLGVEESYFTPCTKDFDIDISLCSSTPVVRFDSVRQEGCPRSIQVNPLSTLMPGSIDYETINPEQPTTVKPVCMWGRRLERIPKVRLAGQKEAVYCFDSRKQRQKQKIVNVAPSRQPPENVRLEQPTRIFYRARPLSSPFVRRDLPATPIDAVKITQGQVLLQNVTPVRFVSTTSQLFMVTEQHPFRRLPLTPRTNDAGQRAYTQTTLHMKKFPGHGFL